MEEVSRWSRSGDDRSGSKPELHVPPGRCLLCGEQRTSVPYCVSIVPGWTALSRAAAGYTERSKKHCSIFSMTKDGIHPVPAVSSWGVYRYCSHIIAAPAARVESIHW